MATKKSTNKAVEDIYDGNKIIELPFPKNVQLRGQMFIGPMDFSGILTCLREILNNSVDEFLAGHCTHISIIRHDEWSFEVLDNGRGVPFDVIDGRNSLSKIFGTLNAGRNFEAKTVYSTGLNGVGSTCVNALSSVFKVESRRGTSQGFIEFHEGYEKKLTTGKVKTARKAPFDKSSTSVSFVLEPRFFDADLEMENELVEALVRETAYLNNGLTITFEDKVTGVKAKLKHTEGVNDYLREVIMKGNKPLFKQPISLGTDLVKDTKVEIAFTYDGSFSAEKITSFTNTIRTSEGGTHVTGFKRAITQKIIQYVTENKLCKEKVTNDDVYSGLNAVVSVFVFNPKYTSQTKQCLKNTEVMGHVVTYANRALDEWLNTNPAEIKVIATKLDLVAKARIAQKRALDNIKKDSANALSSLSNIAKFSDCEEQMSGRTEIFFVEGDSAGGTVGEARDKRYQALYKLKGKVLNTLGMDLGKARTNKEVDDLISVLRCGAGRNLDMDKLKFDKLIALADADSDG